MDLSNVWFVTRNSGKLQKSFSVKAELGDVLHAACLQTVCVFKRVHRAPAAHVALRQVLTWFSSKSLRLVAPCCFTPAALFSWISNYSNTEKQTTISSVQDEEGRGACRREVWKLCCRKKKSVAQVKDRKKGNDLLSLAKWGQTYFNMLLTSLIPYRQKQKGRNGRWKHKGFTQRRHLFQKGIFWNELAPLSRLDFISWLVAGLWPITRHVNTQHTPPHCQVKVKQRWWQREGGAVVVKWIFLHLFLSE